MARNDMPDVIVVLPGILGSVLQKNGQDVWALSAGALARGVLTGLGSVRDLAVGDDRPEVEDLGDGITATRLMPDTHVIPGFWKIDGYSRITQMINAKFLVTPGENYFEFPYDWRRDNRVAAQRLARASRDWLKTWQNRAGNQKAKLILLCHSMGGLVARYFLEKLGGWENTRSLITFGTPYRGSLNALDFIANGLQKKLGPVTLLDLSELLRSFTSVYQLLPTFECYDRGDRKLLKVGKTAGIPKVDAAKAAKALEFHDEIQIAVDSHLKDEKYNEEGYLTYPIVGTHQPTYQSARLEGASVRMLSEYGGKDLGGDGTVPRISGTPIELSKAKREMFTATRHGSLQNADSVLVQLEDILLGNQIELGLFKAGEGLRQFVRLGLDVEDAYSSAEPIKMRVYPDGDVESLRATFINTETHVITATAELKPGGASIEAELPPQAPGVYRVTVVGDRWVSPVEDVVLVL